MKKFLVLAAVAAFALVSCEQKHDIDQGGPTPEAFTGVKPILINSLAYFL